MIIMNLKKILTFAGIALVLYFLVADPNGSAGVVNSLFRSLQQGAEAIIQFVRNLI